MESLSLFSGLMLLIAAGVITQVHPSLVLLELHLNHKNKNHPEKFMGQFNFMKMFQSHLLSLCRAYLDLHLPVSVPDPDHSDVSRRHEEAGLLLPVHHHACTYNTVAGLECSNQHVTRYAPV